MVLGALVRKIFSRRDARPINVKKKHPDEIALQDEVLKSLSLGARRTVRYPPFMEGFPAYLTSDYLLSLQDDLYSKMMGGVGLPYDQFNELVRPVILNYAKFVHLLPASENHHHCGPGGLLRHGMEVAFFSMNATKNTAFDSRRPPSERSRRAIRWNVAGLLCGLLHDTGKAVTDMHVVFPPEGLRWIHSEHTIEEWAQENNLSKYYIEWQKGRHNRHIQKSYALVMTLCPPSTLTWLIEGGEDILDALMDAIVGNEDSPLYRPLMKADGRSTKLDMASGEAPQFMTGVPVLKLVTAAMTRLVQDGTWQWNEPGARVWSTTQGIFIAWATGAQEIINLILEDKVEAIPRTPNSLLMRLIDQTIAERSPEGEMYWEVAPDCLQKGEKPLILRCMKLASADTLFPYDPVPPPVGVRLRLNGELVAFPPPNDSRSDNNALDEAADDAPIPEQGAAPSMVSEQETPSPAKKAPEPNPDADMGHAAEVPDSPDNGHDARSSLIDPVLSRIAEIDFADGDEQTFEDGIQQALRVLGGGDHQHETTRETTAPSQKDGDGPQEDDRPVLDEAAERADEPQQQGADAEAKPTKAETLLRPSHISLKQERTVSLGRGSGKSKKPRPPTPDAPSKPVPMSLAHKPKADSAAPVTAKAAPAATSSAVAVTPNPAPAQPRLNLEQWNLTDQEQQVLTMHPELAQAVLATLNQSELYGVYLRRLFIPLKTRHAAGINKRLVPKLVAAGWLWEDFTSATGYIYTLRRQEGVVPTSWLENLLARNISREITGLQSAEITEEQIAGLGPLTEALLEQCRPETLPTGAQVLVITLHMMKQIASTFNANPEDAYAALHTHRDAVHDWRRKSVYVLPLDGEFKRLSS